MGMEDSILPVTPNPWRETVRDVYDKMHLGTESIFTGNQLAKDVVEFIEERHPEFFGKHR